MAEVFVKVSKEDGTEEFVPAPEETVVEVVKAHPIYKNVLDEHIKSRNKLKQLRESVVDKPVVNEQEMAPEKVDKPTPTVDIEKLKAELLEEIRKTELANKQKQATVAQLIAQHSLPDNEDTRTLLLEANDPAATAERLKRAGLQFEVTPTGNALGSDFTARVLKRMGVST